MGEIVTRLWLVLVEQN